MYNVGDRVEFEGGDGRRTGTIIDTVETSLELMYVIETWNEEIHEVLLGDIEGRIPTRPEVEEVPLGMPTMTWRPIPAPTRGPNMDDMAVIGELVRTPHESLAESLRQSFYTQTATPPTPYFTTTEIDGQPTSREIPPITLASPESMPEQRDYTPYGGASSLRSFDLRTFHPEGFIISPHLIGGIYIFVDSNGRRWLNEIKSPGVIRYLDECLRDTCGINWIPDDRFRELEHSRLSGQLPPIKKKSNKKLRRKQPIPELKEEKHYGDKSYIA